MSAPGGPEPFRSPESAARGTAEKTVSAEKGTVMFCNNCNNSAIWLIILIIILFGWGGSGFGCCESNNGCGCGCGCN